MICPNVKVNLELSGPEGNAFHVVGATVRAMKADGVKNKIIEQYRKEAFGGDYDNLLAVTKKYVCFNQGE